LFFSCVSMHGYHYYCTQSEFWLDPILDDLVEIRLASHYWSMCVAASPGTVGTRSVFCLMSFCVASSKTGQYQGCAGRNDQGRRVKALAGFGGSRVHGGNRASWWSRSRLPAINTITSSIKSIKAIEPEAGIIE